MNLNNCEHIETVEFQDSTVFYILILRLIIKKFPKRE